MSACDHQHEADGADDRELCADSHDDQREAGQNGQDTVDRTRGWLAGGNPDCSFRSRFGSAAASSCSSFSRRLRSSSDRAMGTFLLPEVRP